MTESRIQPESYFQLSISFFPCSFGQFVKIVDFHTSFYNLSRVVLPGQSLSLIGEILFENL